MSYIGDIALGKTFDTKFCTVTTTGAPTVLAGSPVISAYVDNSVTQITAGITLTVDFDSVVGLNNIRVVATSGNGYAAGSNYQLVITTGTVGGTSVVGYVVAEFSIEARSSLRPTTADRTLDVSTGGEAGLDWANIGSPTTAQNLSATNIDVDQTIASVSGIVTANVTQLGGVAQSLTDLKDFADDGYDPVTNKVQGVVLTDTLTTYTGDTPQTGDSFARIGVAGAGLTAIDLPDQTMNITGNLSGSVGSVTGLTASNLDATISSRATPAQVNTEVDTALVDARLDELLIADSDIDGAAPPTVGSVFHELLTKTAGSFTYDQTTDSMEALRDNLATTTALDAVDNFIDTEITDIQNRLPAALVNGRMDSNMQAAANGVITALVIATDAIGSSALAATAVTEIQTGLSTLTAAQINAEIVDALTVDLIADSYAADGAQPTLTQAILAIQQFLMEKAVVNTTVTVKKPNGSTSAFTLTLDSPTAPTSITRAT